jgi:hypothetical protein
MIIPVTDLIFLGENPNVILFGDTKGNVIAINKIPALHVPEEALIGNEFMMASVDFGKHNVLLLSNGEFPEHPTEITYENISMKYLPDNKGKPVVKCGYSVRNNRWVVVDPMPYKKDGT